MSSFTPLVVPKLNTQPQDGDRGRGYAEGYAEGSRVAEAELGRKVAELEQQHQATLAAVRAEADQLLAMLRAAAAALDARVAPVAAEAQDAVLAGAIQVAEAIVGRELATGEDRARSVATRALSTPAAAAAKTIRVHPTDLNLMGALGLATDLFAADPALAPGDAVVDLESGYVDASVRTAVARARAELLGEGA